MSKKWLGFSALALTALAGKGTPLQNDKTVPETSFSTSPATLAHGPLPLPRTPGEIPAVVGRTEAINDKKEIGVETAGPQRFIKGGNPDSRAEGKNGLRLV